MFGTPNKSLQFLPPLLFVLLASACGPKKEEQTVVFLVGPPEITETIRRGLIDNPKEIPPRLGSEYPIRTFHPKRGIEHKIITFQSDPNIDFKMTVFNPFGPIPEGFPEKLKPFLQQQKPGRLDQSEKQK